MKHVIAFILIVCVVTGSIPFPVSEAPASISRQAITTIKPCILTSLDKVAIGELSWDVNDFFLLPQPLRLPSEGAITGQDLSLVSEWPASPPKKNTVKHKTKKNRR